MNSLKRDLWKGKYYAIVFFLLFAAVNICSQYLTLYFKEIGFDSTKISLLIGFGAIATAFGGPTWGFLSDKGRYRKTILYSILIGSSISFFLIQFNSNFIYVFVLNLLFSFFYFSYQPIYAGVAMEFVKKENANFGILRFFGTFGYGISAVFFGLFGNSNIIFISFVILNIFAYFFIFKLNKYPKEKKEHIKEKNILKHIFIDKEIVIFILYAGLINLTIGVYNCFYGIYYTTNLGASVKLFGLLTLISTFAELPFLFFSDKLIKKFGIYNIMLFAGVTSIIRWFLTFFTTSPILQIIIQISHGLGFILILTCMVTYIEYKVSPNFKSTGQSLYGTIILIFSKVFPAFIVGILDDLIGLRFIFLACGFIGILSVAGFIFLKKIGLIK